MLDQRYIQKFDEIILLNRDFPQFLAFNFLFFIRRHDVFKDNYKFLGLFPLFQFILVMPIFLLHFLKYISLLFINLPFSLIKTNYQKLSDCLFITHSINDFEEKDLYFPSWDQELKNEFGLLSKNLCFDYSKKVFKDLKRKKIYIPKYLNPVAEIKIFLSQLHLILLIIIKLFQAKDTQEVSIYLKMISEVFSSSVINNIRFYKYLYKQFTFSKPKYLFITFEGHAWETLALIVAKRFSVSVFAYQHSAIFSDQHSIFRNLPELHPDVICIPGSGYKHFYKNFSRSKIAVTGSVRSFEFNPEIKELGDTILLLPEGIDSELFAFIDLASSAIEINNDLNFMLQLHPFHRTDKAINTIKAMIKTKGIHERITINESDLTYDVFKSKIALYRGSSLIIKLLGWGAYPVFYGSNMIYQDPIFWIEKELINKGSDLDSLIKNFDYLNKRSIIKDMQYCCSSYFQEQNLKTLGVHFGK